MSAPGIERKWAGAEATEHYARGRFSSPRAAGRDPAIVARLLSDHGLVSDARLLDAPCGSGRLAGVLAGCVALDANRPMVARARAAAGVRAGVQGSLLALPFADRSFDAVVCCRLLHHLRDEEELARAVDELVRVSRRLVVASFWDSCALPSLRVRLGLRRDEGPLGRRALPRRRLAALFEEAGAPVREFRSVLRFVSQQTFLVAARPDAGR